MRSTDSEPLGISSFGGGRAIFDHEQTIAPGGVVRTVQRLRLLPPLPHVDGTTLLAAGRFYMDFLRRFGRPLLRVAERPDGSTTVGLPGLVLLTFGAPEVQAREGELLVRYPIQGGAVVQPHGHGQGYLAVVVGPDQLSLEVSGYHARLPGAGGSRIRHLFYLATQSTLHVAIARRFLPALHRWLTAGVHR